MVLAAELFITDETVKQVVLYAVPAVSVAVAGTATYVLAIIGFYANEFSHDLSRKRKVSNAKLGLAAAQRHLDQALNDPSSTAEHIAELRREVEAARMTLVGLEVGRIAVPPIQSRP